jgi:anaerobic magnesium-protoporphyrin IX monomethyl ester cyclase
MRVLFVEPPKEIWFVMGKYLPPPFGIIQLAAYLEREVENVEIEVVDCNAQHLDWQDLERRIHAFNPDMVASGALATCNTYLVFRTVETAKKVNPDVLTVAGGQHLTATAQDSLEACPELDVIVRGEGEVTLTEIVEKGGARSAFPKIRGISFRRNGKVRHGGVPIDARFVPNGRTGRARGGRSRPNGLPMKWSFVTKTMAAGSSG